MYTQVLRGKVNCKGTAKQQIIQIRKSKQPKIHQHKTTLVQLPLTTLSQEKRWAYSKPLPSPHKLQRQLPVNCLYKNLCSIPACYLILAEIT